MFLAKSGNHYVKAIGGRPVFRSTPNLHEAARFKTADAAREHAANVFAKSMLVDLEVVKEPTATTFSPSEVRISRRDRFNEEPNDPRDDYMGR